MRSPRQSMEEMRLKAMGAAESQARGPPLPVRVFDETAHVRIMQCEVRDEFGAFRPATVFRSKRSPLDVVIWYGGYHYEGLYGGYTFNNTVLRDPDGVVIEYRCAAAPWRGAPTTRHDIAALRALCEIGQAPRHVEMHGMQAEV